MVVPHYVYQECGQIQWKVGAYPGEVSPVWAALCGTSLWGEGHPKSRFMGKNFKWNSGKPSKLFVRERIGQTGKTRFEHPLRKMDENKYVLSRGCSESLGKHPQPEKGAYYRGIWGLKQGGRRRQGVNLDPELISCAWTMSPGQSWFFLFRSSDPRLTLQALYHEVK